jgi:hypothetical protein
VRYRIAFAKRFKSSGRESSIEPSFSLDSSLADGVVAEKTFVGRLEPQAQHSQSVLDEDDAFLGSAAPEIWEYEVVDERAQEFEQTIRESAGILEFEVVDDTPTDAEDAPDPILMGDPDVSENQPQPEDATKHGSGVRAADDGPSGHPTADPSAGGLNVGSWSVGLDSEEAIAAESSQELDDLNVMNAKDPRLGLTNRGKKRPEDWAADTGESRTPDRGIAGEGQADYGSTLGRRKR